MMWWTAIAFGLLGSLHCMGMCGPIALAVPTGNGSVFSKYFRFFLYNSGRILSYSVLGLLLGILGNGLQMAGFQQTISIISGIIIIISVILIYYLPRKNRMHFLTKIIQKPFAKFFKNKTRFSVFMIGVLNGFLPCGLVYLALAGATAQANALQGTIYMALFGLGTIPAMFALRAGIDWVSQTFRLKLRHFVPVFSLIIGLLFIIRGMGLGIPYVSPEFVNEQNEKGEIIQKAKCCSNTQNNSDKKTKSCCSKGIKGCH